MMVNHNKILNYGWNPSQHCYAHSRVYHQVINKPDLSEILVVQVGFFVLEDFTHEDLQKYHLTVPQALSDLY